MKSQFRKSNCRYLPPVLWYVVCGMRFDVTCTHFLGPCLQFRRIKSYKRAVPVNTALLAFSILAQVSTRELSLEVITGLCESAPSVLRERGAAVVSVVVPLTIDMLAQPPQGGSSVWSIANKCRCFECIVWVHRYVEDRLFWSMDLLDRSDLVHV